MRLDRGVQTRKITIAGEGARDRVKRLDIRRQRLQRGGEPHLREAAGAQAAREVAGVADRLLQQDGDLGGGRLRRVVACGELAGERRAQRGDAGEILAQPVMQLRPQALPFPIAGLDPFALAARPRKLAVFDLVLRNRALSLSSAGMRGRLCVLFWNRCSSCAAWLPDVRADE